MRQKSPLSWRHFNLPTTVLCTLLVLGFVTPVSAATSNADHSLKIGFVNFRECVEKSKFGKKEHEAFELLQNQMESSLMELQKQLSETATKLQDEDYIDSLSPEAESELKHKHRALSQEMNMTHQQYLQTLQQANMQVMQSIAAKVNEAAKELARQRQLDLVINEETSFYHNPALEVTTQIIATLDKNFEHENKKLESDGKAGQK